MNKLTFWEYFTSSFTNRLLTKTIRKADKAVLLLLEYISEAIFSDRSLWGSTMQWARTIPCFCFPSQQLHALSRITLSSSSRAASATGVLELCSSTPGSSANQAPAPQPLLTAAGCKDSSSNTQPHTLHLYLTDAAKQGALGQPWTATWTQTFLGSVPLKHHSGTSPKRDPFLRQQTQQISSKKTVRLINEESCCLQHEHFTDCRITYGNEFLKEEED